MTERPERRKRRSAPSGAGLPNPVVALPFLWRRMRASLRPRPGAAPVVPFDPQALERNPAVTWIGHATFYVRMDAATFLTDPIYSERASPFAFAGPRRLVPPGVPLEALPRLDFVLLSHDHYDHTDLPTVRRLAARGVPFVVPTGVARPRDTGRRPRRGRARLVAGRDGRRRDRDLRAGPPLLRPRPHRPQPPPLGRLRGDREGTPLSTTPVTRRSSTASPRSAGGRDRSISPACRSAPTSRGPSWGRST